MTCKGVQDLHVVKILDDVLELQGNLVFHNPNSMRARLGKIDIDVYVNKNVAGKIHDEFKTAVKGNEDFLFSFQVRFPRDFVMKDSVTLHDLPISVTGTAGSDVLFADYTFPVSWSGNVKNEF
ncbi:MAG: hypothetical protein JWO03_99 [Bacteroidetes bacterium]|nr:hypothetical protein [Bacteroidota bacterium]